MMVFCGVRHGSITPALLNEDKSRRGDLWAINRLPRLTSRPLLSRDSHVIIIGLFGPVTARLTFCGYPHMSMSSSSMLIAVTGRCWCLQIRIRRFAILKQSQSQHIWRSCPHRICDWRNFLVPVEQNVSGPGTSLCVALMMMTTAFSSLTNIWENIRPSILRLSFFFLSRD